MMTRMSAQKKAGATPATRRFLMRTATARMATPYRADLGTDSLFTATISGLKPDTRNSYREENEVTDPTADGTVQDVCTIEK